MIYQSQFLFMNGKISRFISVFSYKVGLKITVTNHVTTFFKVNCQDPSYPWFNMVIFSSWLLSCKVFPHYWLCLNINQFKLVEL